MDYQKLYPQIQEFVFQTKANRQQWQITYQNCSDALCNYSDKVTELIQRIDQIPVNQQKNLRCALPIQEQLDQSIILPKLDTMPTVLAADGSQILPDRHAPVYYGLINVGGFVFPGNPQTFPQTVQIPELIYGEQLENFSEARLALQRDIHEREMLLNMGRTIQMPCVGLVDGPLEIWIGGSHSGGDQGDYQRSLNTYFHLLGDLYQQKIGLAGYIDRPESNYLVRLLEIAVATPEELQNLQRFHPFSGVSDVDILGALLKPTQRSALFSLYSQPNIQYPTHSQIGFFYINVGSENHPWLGRVEVPAWVAQEEQWLNLVHTMIVHQCQIMGKIAYPFALHRAHELAVVSNEEKDQITRWILTEMQRSGLPISSYSHKQELKNLPSRREWKNPLGGKM